MIWWKRNPFFLQEINTSLLQYPKLKLRKDEDTYLIQGEWDVFGKSKFVRSYQILICIPTDYPREVPQVFETGGKIPRISDRHIFSNTSACCLFVPPQRWEKWPPTMGMKEFLDGPVKEFFFSQAYFELTGKWPFGECRHGDNGIIDYYLLKLGFNNKEQLKKFLQDLPYSYSLGQWKYPCSKKQTFKKCHWERFLKLQQFLPSQELALLEKII